MTDYLFLTDFVRLCQIRIEIEKIKITEYKRKAC